jgi:hypothetical protein
MRKRTMVVAPIKGRHGGLPVRRFPSKRVWARQHGNPFKNLFVYPGMGFALSIKKYLNTLS